MKFVFIVSIYLFIPLVICSQNIDSGLVAYYKFDGNVNDASGNFNNGSEIYGGVNFSNGLIGDCANFGGVNNPGHIKIANDNSFKVFYAMSISLWFKVHSSLGMDGYGGLTTDNAGQCIIAKSNDASGYFVKLYYDGKKKILSYSFSNAYEWLKNNIDLSGKILNYDLDTWKHMVIVFSKTNISCYIDSKLNAKASIELPSFYAANTQDLYFGKFSNKWYPFNGSLDEIRVYNRALTEKEIKSLFNINNKSKQNENLIVFDTLAVARKYFEEEKYVLVIELLKDLSTDNNKYDEALLLLNNAASKLIANSNQDFVTISGRIECGCSKLINGYVVFEDLNSRINIGKCRITSDGYYFILLPSGKKYSYYIDSKDFYPVSRIVDFTLSGQYPNVKDNITLVSYDEMKQKQLAVRINNIFFDFNKSELKQESYLELDRLFNYLYDNQDIRIELSGHTDNIGSDEYNLNLSQSRANTVKEYLVNKGINSDRIVARGYGESSPVATNDTDEGRQLNRRVEFKIIK